ncbi:hypothetical protein [Desmospora profundinema]|uniref:Uncharacterized protein n=1 Tax=Desmospora profundinema TaxID=1571184 RepID=A0ABU1IMJ2_9BACL|nr:hypothetical protein [Desmospora profundinema]MDR6225179.1 hypothetical protein [Desmospora profundinema]
MKETMRRKLFSAFVAWGFFAIYSGLYMVYEILHLTGFFSIFSGLYTAYEILHLGPYSPTPDYLLWFWIYASIISALVILGIGMPVSLLSDWVTRNNPPYRPFIAFLIHAGFIAFMFAIMLDAGVGYAEARYEIKSVPAFIYLMIAIVFWMADEYYRKKKRAS